MLRLNINVITMQFICIWDAMTEIRMKVMRRSGMAVTDYGINGGVEDDLTKRQQWQTMVVADSII